MHACAIIYLHDQFVYNIFTPMLHIMLQEETTLDQKNLYDPVGIESICYRTREKRLINDCKTTGELRKIWTGISFLWLRNRPIFFSHPGRIRVNLLSYDSNTTNKRDQYDWMAEKNWTGSSFSVIVCHISSHCS